MGIAIQLERDFALSGLDTEVRIDSVAVENRTIDPFHPVQILLSAPGTDGV